MLNDINNEKFKFENLKQKPVKKFIQKLYSLVDVSIMNFFSIKTNIIY